MKRVLLTAFEAYDVWAENSSWLTLVEFTCAVPAGVEVTTRLYPVEFDQLAECLEQDLQAGVDVAVHLGQSPGLARIELESIGINVRGDRLDAPEQYVRLIEKGPVALQSQLPLARWASLLNSAGIPASVSYHAGAYLCNAALYLSLYLAQRHRLPTKSAFLHIPLDTSQVIGCQSDLASQSVHTSAAALRMIVEDLVDRPRDL